jgi:hypothetical protein
MKIKKIPFLLTLSAFALPIATIYFGEIINFLFAIFYLIVSIYFINFNYKYSHFFYFLVLSLILLFFLSIIIRGNLLYYKYVYFIYYGVLNYVIFSSIKKENNFNYFNLKFISLYKFLLYSLFTEFIFSLIFGAETISNFLTSDISKGYQQLHSRFLNSLTGTNIFTGLNSLFLGPQAASLIILFMMIIFNPYEKSNLLSSRRYFFLALLLFLISPTTTIFVLLICLIIFKNLKFSFKNLKYIILAILILFSLKSILLDLYLDELSFYFEIYLMPMYAYFKLNFYYFLFGIPVNSDISDYTINHEWGLFETLILSGFFPIFLFIIVLIFTFYKYKNISYKFNFKSNKFYLVQSSIVILVLSFFSLIHYASIFNPGFFQLMGLHLGFLLYTFDDFKDNIYD